MRHSWRESERVYENMHRKFKKNLRFKKIYLSLCSQKQWWVRITVSTRDSQSRNRSSILLPTTRRRGRLKKVGLFFVRFEVSQRQQIASGKRRIFEGAPYQKRLPLTKTPLSLSTPAPFTVFCIPLTRNLSPAAPSPCSEGGQAFQRQLPPAFQRWSSFLAV